MTDPLHCPICRRPVTWEGNLFRPFCSESCQIIDLGSWRRAGIASPATRLPSRQTLPTHPNSLSA
ncbi:MAG: DNA gyrase inhibitor YacG [Nitrospiraceae bacterium]